MSIDGDDGNVFDFQSADSETIDKLKQKLHQRGEKERWVIPADEIKVYGDVMAKGSFGQLRKVKWRSLDCIARSFPGGDLRSLKMIDNEIAVLSSLRHPHIAMFLGAVFEENNTTVIMEYYEGGGLRNVFKYKKKASLNESLKLVQELALGLNFLHKSKVLHRALSPACILMTKTGILKVGNFGSSVFCKAGEEIQDNFHHNDDCEAYHFQAPEIVDKKPYGHKADVYSFALLAYLIVSRKDPYSSMKPNEFEEAVVAGVRPTTDKIVKDKSVVNLLRHSWEANPEVRFSFEDIISKFQVDHKKIKVNCV